MFVVLEWGLVPEMNDSELLLTGEVLAPILAGSSESSRSASALHAPVTQADMLSIGKVSLT